MLGLGYPPTSVSVRFGPNFTTRNVCEGTGLGTPISFYGLFPKFLHIKNTPFTSAKELFTVYYPDTEKEYEKI